jgi:hypothetical protein
MPDTPGRAPRSVWWTKKRTRIFFVVAYLFVGLGAARVFGGVPGSTEELLQYGSRLQLGDSREQVHAALPDGMFSSLTANTDNEGVLIVSTPYRLGASEQPDIAVDAMWRQ